MAPPFVESLELQANLNRVSPGFCYWPTDATQVSPIGLKERLVEATNILLFVVMNVREM